jgi:hypothetical protein
MKKTLLGLIPLSGILLLAGCAGSPSLSSEIQLIEYEKCLSAEETQFLAAAQAANEEDLRRFFSEQRKEGLLVGTFIDACQEFRPE